MNNGLRQPWALALAIATEISSSRKEALSGKTARIFGNSVEKSKLIFGPWMSLPSLLASPLPSKYRSMHAEKLDISLHLDCTIFTEPFKI